MWIERSNYDSMITRLNQKDEQIARMKQLNNDQANQILTLKEQIEDLNNYIRLLKALTKKGN